MKSVFDIVIVGGATAGSYFANKMAKKGYSVLILEKQSQQNVGDKYDIFHIAKDDFAKYDAPLPIEGDRSWAFEFEANCSVAANGMYPKDTVYPVVGLHMHEYVLQLNNWAIEAGAKIEYDATFVDFTYNRAKAINGVKYVKDGQTYTIQSRLVVDCSGIPSVARRKLPAESLVENFEISSLDMFYVILRYVTFLDAKDYIKGSKGWLYFKTWQAPQPNPNGAILGVGANFSFEYADKVFDLFTRSVQLPQYKVDYIEKGYTPFRRPPYSFVDDGFLAMGDAACLTKPFSGEGVTSAWTQSMIAVDIVDNALKTKGYVTDDSLWQINKLYINEQGAKFAGSLATLIGAVGTSSKENTYLYKHDIVFSAKSFECMNQHMEISFTSAEITKMAFKMLGGLLTGNLRLSTIKSMLKSMKDGDKIKKHYLAFPSTPSGYRDWVEQADAIWKQIGNVSDVKPIV